MALLGHCLPRHPKDKKLCFPSHSQVESNFPLGCGVTLFPILPVSPCCHGVEGSPQVQGQERSLKGENGQIRGKDGLCLAGIWWVLSSFRDGVSHCSCSPTFPLPLLLGPESVPLYGSDKGQCCPDCPCLDIFPSSFAVRLGPWNNLGQGRLVGCSWDGEMKSQRVSSIPFCPESASTEPKGLRGQCRTQDGGSWVPERGLSRGESPLPTHTERHLQENYSLVALSALGPNVAKSSSAKHILKRPELALGSRHLLGSLG